MKKLTFNTIEYQAEKIIRTFDSVIGHNGQTEVFAFRGISDISLFKLEEGEEWDLSKEDEEALSYLDLDFRISKIELGV